MPRGLTILPGIRHSAHLLLAAALFAGCEVEPATDPFPGDRQIVITDETIRDHPQPDYQIVDWHTVEDLPGTLVRFETVFWDPDDTHSLRALIRQSESVYGKSVLEIGTGTGLLSLCALHAGALHVVATDINPAAVHNAAFNAQRLGVESRLELRLVDPASPEAFSVIGEDERFDLILSNPPWEDARPQRVDEYALFDESFVLLRSLVSGLRDHLRPDGKALLAYGNVTAIRMLQNLAREHGLALRILDERDLADLPEVFLPGMLIELSLTSKADR